MTIALLTLNSLSLVALGATAVYGRLIPQGGGALGRHLMLALIAILLSLFAQTMTFFYFIGMGSSIRSAVQQVGLGAYMLEENRRLKSKVFPWAAGAMGVLMTAFILGGAAHTRVLPGWAHGGLGYLALAVSLAAFFVEAYYLFRQNFQFNELQRQMAALAQSETRGLASSAAVEVPRSPSTTSE